MPTMFSLFMCLFLHVQRKVVMVTPNMETKNLMSGVKKNFGMK